jgi:hypothetical protein
MGTVAPFPFPDHPFPLNVPGYREAQGVTEA